MVKFRWLLLLSLGLASTLSGQAKPATAMKDYFDPETGVSFRYPAAWTKSMAGCYCSDPLEEEKGKDDARPPVLRLEVGWDTVSDTEDENRKAYSSSGSTFAYALLPEKTAAACAARFDGWDSDGKGASIVVNGVNFHVVAYSDAGLGHSWQFDVYTIFRRGKCLGFSAGTSHSWLDEPVRSPKRRIAVPSDPDEVFKTVRFR